LERLLRESTGGENLLALGLEADITASAQLDTVDIVPQLDFMQNANEKYIALAMKEGAENVVAVTPNDIVFDGRTLLKCMFGCSDWGKGCTCPSRTGFLKPWEFEQLLRKYTSVLIIHSRDKRIAQKASYAVEQSAFLDGDVFAFAMSDCALCKECAGQTCLPCRNPKQARPAFHSVGIDVFATVRKLGLPIEPLQGVEEEQNWYAAVWLNG
jgi:predicted metal-binding protein